MSELVNREVASNDVKKWLDIRCVSEKKREDFPEHVEDLVSAVCEGQIIIDESGKLTQKLKFPLGESGSIKELVYHPRVSVMDVRAALSALNGKTMDADSRVIANIAAATRMATNVVLRMDTADYSLAQVIALFFL